MKKLIVLGFILLAGCGDRGWYTPSTEVSVTRKGCSLSDGRGRAEVFVNITSERLPNGQIRCVIDTLAETNKDAT